MLLRTWVCRQLFETPLSVLRVLILKWNLDPVAVLFLGFGDPSHRFPYGYTDSVRGFRLLYVLADACCSLFFRREQGGSRGGFDLSPTLTEKFTQNRATISERPTAHAGPRFCCVSVVVGTRPVSPLKLDAQREARPPPDQPSPACRGGSFTPLSPTPQTDASLQSRRLLSKPLAVSWLVPLGGASFSRAEERSWPGLLHS